MVFTVVMAHAATAFWHHFHPWTTKNMDLETVCHFAIPNHRKLKTCVQSRSRGAPQIRPKTHPKLVKSSFGAPRCPRKCPCDLWMTKKLIQDTRKEPPSPQRDTSEYRKVIPTRIPNALKCENRIMTSKLRNFEVEETLNRDFNLKVILSNRQPFNPISKSKKR